MFCFQKPSVLSSNNDVIPPTHAHIRTFWEALSHQDLALNQASSIFRGCRNAFICSYESDMSNISMAGGSLKCYLVVGGYKSDYAALWSHSPVPHFSPIYILLSQKNRFLVHACYGCAVTMSLKPWMLSILPFKLIVSTNTHTHILKRITLISPHSWRH